MNVAARQAGLAPGGSCYLGVRGAHGGADSDPGTPAFAQSSPCPRAREQAKEQEFLFSFRGCINPTVLQCLLLSLLFGLVHLPSA